MRVSVGVVGVCLALAGCQSFFSAPAPVASADAATPAADVPPHPAKVSAKPAAPAAPVPEVPAPSLILPFETDAASVDAGIVAPPFPAGDPRQAAMLSEKAEVDRLVASGALTREGGAKRLYRFAAKNDLVKGKADEGFWQTLIQTYRNLDDHYITAEDAASDINAAAARRAAGK